MCQQLIGDINHVRGYRYFTRVQLRLLSGLKSLIKHHSSCSKQYSYFHALANWKCDVDMHKFLGITQTEKSNMFFLFLRQNPRVTLDLQSHITVQMANVRVSKNETKMVFSFRR